MASHHPAYTVAAINTYAGRIRGRLPAEGHSHARQLETEVTKLANSATALGRVFDTQSPTETADAHEKKIAAAAKVFGGQVSATRDRIHAILKTGLEDIDGRARKTTGLKADRFEEEIRATFRSLDQDQKHSLLGELAENGKGAELAAIIDAPTVVTGITKEDVTRYREALETKHAPAEYRERNALTEAFIEAFDATTQGADLAGSLGDPARLALIERGEAAAAEALAAFNTAVAA